MQCAWAGLYAPTAADTPLRLWLQHHGVDEPLGTGALARDSAWAGRGDGLAPLPATIRELEAGGARSTMDMRSRPCGLISMLTGRYTGCAVRRCDGG